MMDLADLAYNEGFEAYEMGIIDNPYEALVEWELHSQWLAGFQRAEYEANTYFDWDKEAEIADYEDEEFEQLVEEELDS
jgi:hypothetical protein